VHTRFWWGNLKEGKLLENLGVDGRVRVKWILKEFGWGLEFIVLPQDRDRWWAVSKTVMKLRRSLKCGTYWTSRGTVDF